MLKTEQGEMENSKSMRDLHCYIEQGTTEHLLRELCEEGLRFEI